jgi:hypothetical protein
MEVEPVLQRVQPSPIKSGKLDGTLLTGTMTLFLQYLAMFLTS